MIVNIHKFYKRNQIDVLMFGYVNAFMFNFPAVTLEKALLNFQKHHGLTEETFNIEVNKVVYYRMRDEFIDLSKTQKTA
jgi:hypothetical protein